MAGSKKTNQEAKGVVPATETNEQTATPTGNSMWETSDGVKFKAKHHAEKHAVTLKNKTVKQVAD
jgi:hypothetical protein